MTSPHPAPVAADPVVAALGGLGTPLDCTGMRSLSLEGPLVLWLVVEGELDLFAIDAAQEGHWHFLGRLAPGTLLLGPAEGPGHTLIGRPLQGCLLRRVELRELQPHGQAEYGPGEYGQGEYGPGEYGHGGYGQGAYGVGEVPLSPLENAFALGIGRGLRVLYQAPLESRATAGPGAADDDVLWMQITPGSVRYGAVYEGYDGYDTAAALLVDGAMWQGMVDQQYRLLYALDHWIEQAERAHEDRTAAGIQAGEAARTQADQALLASIGRPGGRSRGAAGRGGGDDAAFAVCRLVAREAGITLSEPVGTGADTGGTDPVERIAVASRIRTRVVSLHGRWWRENSGPLVGRRAEDGAPVALLWRRGGYEAVDPADGTRERVDAADEGTFEPGAVMFYRPLPDGRPGLARLLRFRSSGPRNGSGSSSNRDSTHAWNRVPRRAAGCGALGIGRASSWAKPSGSAARRRTWEAERYAGSTTSRVVARARRSSVVRAVRSRSQEATARASSGVRSPYGSGSGSGSEGGASGSRGAGTASAWVSSGRVSSSQRGSSSSGQRSSGWGSWGTGAALVGLCPP
ncbi:hypothetical protein ACWCQ0_46335, partial [Streptomyces massasporeus]